MSEISVNPSKLKVVAITYIKASKDLQKYEERVENAISQLKDALPNSIPDNLKKVMQNLEDEAVKCNRIGEQVNSIALCYEKCEETIRNQETVKNIEENDKESETKNPEDMTYEEYLRYRYENAVDENTKKFYEKYLENIRIKDDDYDETAYYNGFWNHIKYNIDDDSTDPRGVGSTYYHEVGHLVDDQSDLFGYTSTDNSYDFYEKLNEDLDNYIDKIMDDKGYTDKQDAYDDLSDWLWDDPDMKNGVSDIVLGLTDGEAGGKWGHSDDYYNSRSISKEAFAHFFEAGMETDSKKLDYLKEVFPTAYEEYQKMLEDELK